MSAPRIRIVADAIGDGYAPFVWYCTAWHRGNTTGGETYTIAAAANAGRAHLAAFHTAQMPASIYCRTHGTHSAECECGSGKSPTGDENGAYNAAQPFGDDFPCCTTPMQHAHTHSREDC